MSLHSLCHSTNVWHIYHPRDPGISAFPASFRVARTWVYIISLNHNMRRHELAAATGDDDAKNRHASIAACGPSTTLRASHLHVMAMSSPYAADRPHVLQFSIILSLRRLQQWHGQKRVCPSQQPSRDLGVVSELSSSPERSPNPSCSAVSILFGIRCKWTPLYYRRATNIDSVRWRDARVRNPTDIDPAARTMDPPPSEP